MADTKLLNKEQQEAVIHDDGPLLIIAGAGTGKTTVITERIKHLILERNTPPSSILALTFTEKAAKEMEERIDIALPYGYSQLWIATFHAFCDRILRNEALHIGITPNYKLLRESETVLFLRKHLFDFELQYFRPLGNPNKFLEGIIQHFSRLRDEDITPEEYTIYADGLQENDDITKEEIEKTKELAHAYVTFQQLKAKEGVMDFADLITNVLQLFRKRPNVLKSYQDQFRYILVDEFQDTNFAQNQLAILLAGKNRNITVVGDDDQAIYRWRGAAVSNMIQFRNIFKDSKIITLCRNYRSTQEILDSAYTLITHNNPDRLEVKENIDKKLVAHKKGKQHPIELLFENRVEDEAECTIKTIQELVEKEKRQYKDIAILIRANDHAQPFVRALTRHNIPYQFLGPGRLFRQEEIKDLIAYLKVLYNFEDSSSFYRVLCHPFFKIDARDIAAMLNFMRRKNLSLFEVLEKIEQTNGNAEIFVKDDTKEKIKMLVVMIHKHLQLIQTESAGQILYYFLQDSGMLQHFITAKTEIEVKQYQNIAKFFDKLKSFEAENEDARIFPVIDWIDLNMQMGESPLANDSDWAENDAVNLLTIHASKGLEFPVVFLVNLVSQRFPTRERKEQIPIPQQLIKEILPEGDYHMQEERRLFYVGMTRAKERLYFTAAKFYGEGKRDRKLSPFILETFGEQHVNILLKKQEVRLTTQQPSLLDWLDNAATNEKKIASILEPSQYPFHDNKITYISYSQLQCFSICPMHYKLQYILKIPPKPSAAMSFGISLHGALRDFFHQVVQKQDISKEDILFFLEKNWLTDGYANKEHLKLAYEQAKKVYVEYLNENYFEKKNAAPIAVEIPFQFFIIDQHKEHPPVKVGGRIDRVDMKDGKLEIIDYKTGSNMPSEKDLATNLQLTFYALAATQVHDAIFNKKPEEVVLTLQYIEEGKTLTTTRTADAIILAKEEIFKKVKEIEKSDFLCSKGIFCQNCEFKILCA